MSKIPKKLMIRNERQLKALLKVAKAVASPFTQKMSDATTTASGIAGQLRDTYRSADSYLNRMLQPLIDYSRQFKTNPYLEDDYRTGLAQLDVVSHRLGWSPQQYDTGARYLHYWYLTQMRRLADGKAVDPHVMSAFLAVADTVPEASPLERTAHSNILPDSVWPKSKDTMRFGGIAKRDGRPVVTFQPTTNLMSVVDEAYNENFIVWSSELYIPNHPHYVRTEVVEDWDFGSNSGKAIIGVMEGPLPSEQDLDGGRLVLDGLMQIMTATVEGEIVPLPTKLDELGRPVMYYATNKKTGDVMWLPEAGMFVLRRPASARGKVILRMYATPDLNRPKLTPYITKPSRQFVSDKSNLSNFTRMVFETVTAFGDRSKYGDYALTVEEQMESAAAMLKASWNYELAPKGWEKLQSIGRKGLRLFHTPGGITTANCGFAATELAEAARAFGIPTRIVHGFLAPQGPVAGYSAPMHAWVEFYDGHHWLSVDPTPEMQSLVPKSPKLPGKLEFLMASIKHPGLHPAHMALSQLSEHPSRDELLALVPILQKSPPVYGRINSEYTPMPDGRLLVNDENDVGRVVTALDSSSVSVQIYASILGRVDPSFRLAEKRCNMEASGGPDSFSISQLIHNDDVKMDVLRRRAALAANDQFCGQTQGGPLFIPGPELSAFVTRMDAKVLTAHYNAQGELVLDASPHRPLTLIEYQYPQGFSVTLQQMLEKKSGHPWTHDQVTQWLKDTRFDRIQIANDGREFLLDNRRGVVLLTNGLAIYDNDMWVDAIPYSGRVVTVPKNLRSGRGNVNLGIQFAEAFFAHTQGRAVTESDRDLIIKALWLLLRHPPGRFLGRDNVTSVAAIVYLLEAARALHITDTDVKVLVEGPKRPGGVRECDIMEGCELDVSMIPTWVEDHITGIDDTYRYMIAIMSGNFFKHAWNVSEETMNPHLRRWMQRYLDQKFVKTP